MYGSFRCRTSFIALEHISVHPFLMRLCFTPRMMRECYTESRCPKYTFTRAQLCTKFISQDLNAKLALWLRASDQEAALTLSQSIFDLVIGNALLKLLKVFSLIIWYVSFNLVWNDVSSNSIKAIIFDADVGSNVMVDGRARDTVCVVDSWTCLDWVIVIKTGQ